MSALPQDQLAGLFSLPEQQGRLVDLARAYLAARREKERIEAGLKAASAEALEREQALLQEMEKGGVKSLKVDEDGALSLLTATVSRYYSMPDGGLEDTVFYTWLLRNRGHDLVRRTIHGSTFTAWCRELIEAGKSLFPGIRLAEKKLIRVTRG